MEVEFTDCGYGKDFEGAGYIPGSWEEHDPYKTAFTTFKAYDTSLLETELDKRFHGQGYGFCCEVMVILYIGGPRERLALFPAKDEEEAKRLLQIAADAFYNEEE